MHIEVYSRGLTQAYDRHGFCRFALRIFFFFFNDRTFYSNNTFFVHIMKTIESITKSKKHANKQYGQARAPIFTQTFIIIISQTEVRGSVVL